MDKKTTNDLVVRNMKIVFGIFMLIGLSLTAFGLTTDNSSITAGGVTVIIPGLVIGLVALILPFIARGK